MVIRRSDQRRRRVVIDEVTNAVDAQESNARTRRKKTKATAPETVQNEARLYSASAGRRSQRKTTDFLPKRLFSFVCIVTSLALVIGVINVLAIFSPQWHDLIGDAGSRAFQITGVGSLASWFSSFLLIITGLASLQIYALRQHRCDDYHGTYRIWLWMSGLFLLASVHCVVDLGSVVQGVISATFEQPVGSKIGSRIWVLVIFKIVTLSLLIVRGLFEVNESRGTIAIVALVWLAYASAALLQVPAINENLVIDHEVVYGNLVLVGTALLMIGHLMYGRFVYLQANGMIKAPITDRTVGDASEMRGSKKRKRRTKKTELAKTEIEADPESDTEELTSSNAAQVGISDDVTDATGDGPVVKNAARKKNQVRAEKKGKSKRSPVPKPSATKTRSEPKVARPPVPKPSTQKIDESDLDVAESQFTEKQTSTRRKKRKKGDEEGVQDILSITPDQLEKMSKSERRRQRKLEKRMRRAA